MRLTCLAVGLAVAASASPALAQDAEGVWCAGFVDYLNAETDTARSSLASDSVRDACIAYVRASGGLPIDATAEGTGPVALTDAARIWCLKHDFNANHGGADHDDYDLVADAAGSLEIPIPQPLLDYNLAFWFASHMDWQEDIPGEVVSVYIDWDLSGGRAEWRGSDGYARACMAAYELDS